MFDSILLDNPYEKVYEQYNFNKNLENIAQEDAANLIRHLGFMYNTFGQAIKDFVKIVSCKFVKAQAKPATEPKYLMKKNNKQSKSKSDISDNNPTQNPRNKKSQNNKQKQNNNGENNKKKLLTIKQYPRAANHESFDLDFMSQQINNLKTQMKSQAQKQQIKNLSNINNLSRFHSQFVMIKPPQQKSDLTYQYDSNGSLLNWPKNQEKSATISIKVDEQSKENVNASPVINVDEEESSKEEENSYKIDFNQKQSQIEASSNVRIRGGRKRKDRERLLGVSCMQCQKYYKAMQIEGDKYCDCTSRHRSNFPTRKLKQQFTQQFDL